MKGGHISPVSMIRLIPVAACNPAGIRNIILKGSVVLIADFIRLLLGLIRISSPPLLPLGYILMVG